MSRVLKNLEKPVALLIVPPVYDFALYDLFFKPYGLLRIGRWLEEAGWNCVFVNMLDYKDPATIKLMHNKPRRKKDGTGKFFRQHAVFPDSRHDGKLHQHGRIPDRKYARYGIHPESAENETGRIRPDMIFITTFMTYWHQGVREAVEICRKKWPGVPVAAGGIYSSLLPRHCLDKCGTDYAVEGDGWDPLNRIFEKLSLPQGCSSGCSRVMDNPVWEDAAVIRINQGCPMSCRYCASGRISGFKPGEPDEVFNNLLELYKKHGTKNFAFYDDALLYRKESIFLPFLEKAASAGYDFNFYVPNGLHIEYLDSYTALLMKKAGFREIRLGFESADPEFHALNGGKFDEHKFPELVGILKKSGFKADEIIVYLLAGLPGQEAGEVEESVRYLLALDVKISISEYSPVPGSSLWDESVKKSMFPLEEDPVYHNNSIFPMQWKKFTLSDMDGLKKLAREGCPGQKGDISNPLK